MSPAGTYLALAPARTALPVIFKIRLFLKEKDPGVIWSPKTPALFVLSTKFRFCRVLFSNTREPMEPASKRTNVRMPCQIVLFTKERLSSVVA